MRIFKYRMPAPGVTEDIQMPEGARIVHLALQHGYITAWALVDEGAPARTVTLATVGTGWDVPEGSEYIGTALDGAFVWHVVKANGAS